MKQRRSWNASEDASLLTFSPQRRADTVVCKGLECGVRSGGTKGRLVRDLRRTAVRNLERAGVAVRDDEAAWPQDSGCVAPLRDYLSGRLVGRSFQAR